MRRIKHCFFIMLSFCLLIGTAAGVIPSASAASRMMASEHCVEFIKTVEGFSPQPYYDYNQYTVGYGTKCPSEKYFEYTANGIPRSEAEALLREELAEIEDTLNQKFIEKYNLTFTQHQFDALVSFSYNIGAGWITYDSSLRNAILNNANEDELVYAFGLYCTAGGKYLPGLVTRRLCEANMYLNGIYSKNVSDEFGYVYYDANGGTVTYRVQAFICDNGSTPVANAVLNGDVFLGWYTDLTGGTQVNTLNGTLSGQTLFAHWQSSEDADEQDVTTVTIKVTGDVVNIRSGPGTNYGVVRQSYQNEVLTVSHVTHLTNMKWGKIQDGWICLDYTNYNAVTGEKPDPDTEDEDIPSDDIPKPDNSEAWDEEEPNVDIPADNREVISGVVNVNNYLIIRDGPGTTYPMVGFLFKNDVVEIFAQKTVGTMTWGQIKDGWVCMDYILTGQNTDNKTEESDADSEIPPAVLPENTPSQDTFNDSDKGESVSITGKITADALRIRSGAGTANPIVGFYYQNDRVEIIEKVLVGSDYWGKTDKGWISLDYVMADFISGDTSLPTKSEKKTITADCLRIRKEAGTEYKIVGFLYYGDTVSVLETKDVDGTIWGRVDTGWICMQYAV